MIKINVSLYIILTNVLSKLFPIFQATFGVRIHNFITLRSPLGVYFPTTEHDLRRTFQRMFCFCLGQLSIGFQAYSAAIWCAVYVVGPDAWVTNFFLVSDMFLAPTLALCSK